MKWRRTCWALALCLGTLCTRGAAAQDAHMQASNTQRVLQLQQEYAELSLKPTFHMVGAGAVMLVTGMALTRQAVFDGPVACDQETGNCLSRDVALGFGIAAGVLGVAGASLLTVGLVKLRRRIRRRRELTRRIEELQEPRFALNRVGLALRPGFVGATAGLRF